MRFDEFLRLFPDMHPEPEKARARRILERRGLRFLVDFGTDNAIEKLACRYSWTWR